MLIIFVIESKLKHLNEASFILPSCTAMVFLTWAHTSSHLDGGCHDDFDLHAEFHALRASPPSIPWRTAAPKNVIILPRTCCDVVRYKTFRPPCGRGSKCLGFMLGGIQTRHMVGLLVLQTVGNRLALTVMSNFNSLVKFTRR